MSDRVTSEELRELAEDLNLGCRYAEAIMVVRAADRIDADAEHVDSMNTVLDGLHDRIDALEAEIEAFYDLCKRDPLLRSVARALLGSPETGDAKNE